MQWYADNSTANNRVLMALDGYNVMGRGFSCIPGPAVQLNVTEAGALLSEMSLDRGNCRWVGAVGVRLQVDRCS
jgi:hypothetical protein